MKDNATERNQPVARDRDVFLNRESNTANDLFELFCGMIQVLFDEMDEF